MQPFSNNFKPVPQSEPIVVFTNIKLECSPLCMRLVTGLARLAGRILNSVLMGNFRLVTERKKVRKVGCLSQTVGTSLASMGHLTFIQFKQTVEKLLIS